MLLVLSIDLIVIGVLLFIALAKGLEATLPFATFVIVLMPVQSQLPLPGLFGLTTQRVVIVTLAVLWFLLGSHAKGPRPTGLPVRNLIVASTLWMVISAINSIDPSVAPKYILAEILDLYLLYSVMIKVISRHETVHRLLWAIVAAMAVCCVFGVIEGYQQWSVFSLFPSTNVPLLSVDETRGLRIHSTYPVAHLFGTALAMAFPLTLYLLTVVRTRGQKVLLLIAVMLMGWNVYKTGTRGPWIAWVVGMLPLLFSGATRKRLLTVAVLTVTVLIVRPGVYESVANQYDSTLNPESVEHGTYQGRYELVKFAYGAIMKDPARMLWGYGPETWSKMGFVEVWENGSIHPVKSVDSDVAWYLQSFGFVGTILFFLTLIWPMMRAARASARAPGPEQSLLLSLSGGMLAFLFMTTNVLVYAWGQQGLWIFILMALIMSYPNWRRSSLASGETLRSDARGVGAGNGALVPARGHAFRLGLAAVPVTRVGNWQRGQ